MVTSAIVLETAGLEAVRPDSRMIFGDCGLVPLESGLLARARVAVARASRSDRHAKVLDEPSIMLTATRARR